MTTNSQSLAVTLACCVLCIKGQVQKVLFTCLTKGVIFTEVSRNISLSHFKIITFLLIFGYMFDFLPKMSLNTKNKFDSFI